MKRIVSRVLPDGSIRYVQPYHVCLEGLECAVLCRDDDDYDAFVKVIAVASRRKNVIVVIYTVVIATLPSWHPARRMPMPMVKR